MRFTDALGNAIPYWIDPDNFNTLASSIWVLPASLVSGNSTLYMFYGNATSAIGTHGAPYLVYTIILMAQV